ncbi:MAG: S1/P1 nuclease [Anditalea sp.]
MKKLFFTFFLLSVVVLQSFGWGQNGHRVVALLAEWHLNKKARRNIEAILKQESLPMVANWMDEIRSDEHYDYATTWHYLTVEDGKSYDPSIQEKGGDAYAQLQKIIAALKQGNLTDKEEKEFLKMLVHLVGDIHQPLHVGRGDDRGGNDIKIYYFNQQTNLHSVWDTKMIEAQNLSFTEMSRHLNKRADKATVNKLQSADLTEWLQEAQNLRPMVYDIPDDNRLSYAYNYKYFHLIEDRLFAAGIRLAGILNDIYG